MNDKNVEVEVIAKVDVSMVTRVTEDVYNNLCGGDYGRVKTLALENLYQKLCMALSGSSVRIDGFEGKVFIRDEKEAEEND